MQYESRNIAPLTRVCVDTSDGGKFGVVITNAMQYQLVIVALDDIEKQHIDRDDIPVIDSNGDAWLSKMPLAFAASRVHIADKQQSPPLPEVMQRIRKRHSSEKRACNSRTLDIERKQ